LYEEGPVLSDESILEQLKEKLNRALRAKAVLSERSKQLAQQVEDLKKREDQTDHLVMEMLDRQRELNFMLHRANSVLQRIQEANAILSTEFTELVKELPAPGGGSAPDWEDRVRKINDLFKRTGALADEVQDEIFRRGLDADDIKTTLRDTASKPQATSQPEQGTSSTEPVEMPQPEQETASEQPAEAVVESNDTEPVDHEPEIEAPVEPEVIEAVLVDVASTAVDQIVDMEPIDSEKQQKMDQLFGSKQVDNPDFDLPEQDKAPGDKPDKPGVLSRLWNKLSKRQDGNSHPKQDDSLEDVDIENNASSVSDASSEPDELTCDSKKSESEVACVADSDSTEALSTLLDDTANEVERLSFEFIPLDAEDSAAANKDVSDKPVKRVNRRVRSGQQSGQAPAAG